MMLHYPSTDRPCDEELASRAQRGCAESFDELVERFQVPVLHFLQRRGPVSEAEDLLQDTFVRAYENLHRYRRRWRFATWLFTIARRVSINGRRKRRPSTDNDALARTAATTAGPLDLLVEEDGRRYLWSVADRILSEDERTALWLHYVEEMPAREIAAVLGRSRVAVKTMLFRARRRLLPYLRELDPCAPAGDGSADRKQDASSCPLPLEAHHA
ncbi:MAG: sigma-70 family RNA polymerase sigma factor [Pirellulales bacterium]|nr:sigma-70 family RNA polymerase sigma factor [Pirellulales bacterium]